MEFKHVYISESEWRPMKYLDNGMSMFVSTRNAQYLEWIESGNSPEEIKWFKDNPPDYNSWDDIRELRDQLLVDCDWTQLPDSPLSDEVKTAWATYRQELRDIPQTYGSEGTNIVWPTSP